MSNDRFQFVRAVLKNALFFGTLCGATMGALVTLWVLFVPGPGVESLPERIGNALFAGVGMGIRFFIGGAAIGTFFALAVRYSFRGRRLAEISPIKFAALGAVAGGVGIPIFYQALNVLTNGHMVPWNLLTDDALWAAPFGAIAAAGSIWLARRATVLPSEERTNELGGGDELSGLPAIGKGERSRAER